MYRSWESNGSYPGAIPPPPGVVPDLENHHNSRRTTILTLMIVCGVVSTLFFLTRVYVKVRITRKILPEDVACIISWVLLMLFIAVSAVMFHYGDGYHAWNLTDTEYSAYLKWLYAISIIYSPTAFFVKTTLLLIIARVFAVRERVSRGVYIFIVGMFIAYCPIQIAKIIICRPIRAYWDPLVQGDCVNQHELFLADICVAIFTDLCILIIPIPLTWSLRISLFKKIKIIALLGIGGIGTAIAIYRLVVAIPFVNEIDVTWDFAVLHWTSLVELTIGFICSCFPAVNILIEQRLTGRSNLSPNSPRSSRKRPLPRPQNSRIVASWMGSGVTENTTCATATTSTGDSSVLKSSVRNGDTEQTRLSSNPEQIGGMETDEHGVELEHWNRHRNDSLTSSTGRREGWVSSLQVFRQPSDHGQIMKTVEISMERSRRYSSCQWDMIWDGRKIYRQEERAYKLEAQ